MAESEYRFRTALGGFHKGDVVGYIERTATEHRSELLERDRMIQSLQEENRSLQQQLNLLMMATPAPAPEPAPAPTPEPAPVPEPAPTPEDLMSMELQAYRRAEAAERKASKRVRKIYKQMEIVCDDALDEFSVTDTTVKETIAQMQAQAEAMEQAYRTLSAALTSSREKLSAVTALLYDTEEDPE